MHSILSAGDGHHETGSGGRHGEAGITAPFSGRFRACSVGAPWREWGRVSFWSGLRTAIEAAFETIVARHGPDRWSWRFAAEACCDPPCRRGCVSGDLPGAHVNKAAEHFAGTELVILGLHDSRGAVEEVSTFARKRKMAYPLAIDRSAGDGGGFGATFHAYGIHVIPHAVVIDRQGRVAYVDRFPSALEKLPPPLIKDQPK